MSGSPAELPWSSWLISQVLPEHFLASAPPGLREALLVGGIVLVSSLGAALCIRPAAQRLRRSHKFT